MALDAARKDDVTQAEIRAFYRQTGPVKAFTNQTLMYGGQSYMVFKDVQDPNADIKAAAVPLAVKAIKDKGVAIPSDLRVYCVGNFEAQNRAFHRGKDWQKIALVVLGYNALKSTGTAVSATGLGGHNTPTISCIHEIGHCLHETSAGDDLFWDGDSELTGQPVNAGQVSLYAAGTKKEFVAEVFAGLILGKTFNNAVMEEYRSYRGPAVP